MYFSFSLSVLACSNSGINSSTSWTMACKECFDISKYTGFYSSKTPSHKTPTSVLCGHIVNSRDHKPLSKQLRHTFFSGTNCP